ncbi:amidase [Alkalihalobacillus sp. BA299]|uniref:amidase n=1 Tax=Alkalihalobacillus sp. BA299 TaxID=2815938 RepID=UPI001AD96301|nr:amidase [Alkalihalobacillus sp. BA299]
MLDKFNTFINKDLVIEPKHFGTLNGLLFAVKDVFDIEGNTSSAGNPDWLRTHQRAETNASVIDQLLHEGAKLTGTTITDELMYSLHGENVHYGTPINPNAPQSIPGGSSSGSAVAVAAGLVDFAIGTDTGGSVRVPSAYCGNFGIRPTHNTVSIDGVIPLASSFDTVGWMTRDTETLLRVGQVLLKKLKSHTSKRFKGFLFAEDAWSLADKDSKKILHNFIFKLENQVDASHWLHISEEGLSKWVNTFRVLQGYEIWKAHGEWVQNEKPAFGPGIAERFQMASMITEEENTQQLLVRNKIRQYMEELLGEDKLLIIPTVPGRAPYLQLPSDIVNQIRADTLKLSCIAGLAGLPQVTIPLKDEKEKPIGLSFIAGRNQDLRLLKWVSELNTL